MLRTTNSVQAFVRFAIFLFCFILCGGILLVIASPLMFQKSDFLPAALVIGVVFNLWLSSTISSMFYILPEWERLVLLRLGKYSGTMGPGFFVIPPFIYSVAQIVDIRIMTQQVEATATLTQDNVPTKVTAAIEFEIEDPRKAVIAVQNYLSSVTWLATEALKNTIGSLDLKELLSNRDEIAKQLKNQIDQSAADYGINVRAVRITDVDTPPALIEELAVIARARRAAEAKQIQAQAEIEVANKMAEASAILSKNPGSFKLREIQNLSEISKEESSMIIVYPSDSHAGQQIASASVSLNKQKKPTAK